MKNKWLEETSGPSGPTHTGQNDPIGPTGSIGQDKMLNSGDVLWEYFGVTGVTGPEDIPLGYFELIDLQKKVKTLEEENFVLKQKLESAQHVIYNNNMEKRVKVLDEAIKKKKLEDLKLQILASNPCGMMMPESKEHVIVKGEHPNLEQKAEQTYHPIQCLDKVPIEMDDKIKIDSSNIPSSIKVDCDKPVECTGVLNTNMTDVTKELNGITSQLNHLERSYLATIDTRLKNLENLVNRRTS